MRAIGPRGNSTAACSRQVGGGEACQGDPHRLAPVPPEVGAYGQEIENDLEAVPAGTPASQRYALHSRPWHAPSPLVAARSRTRGERTQKRPGLTTTSPWGARRDGSPGSPFRKVKATGPSLPVFPQRSIRIGPPPGSGLPFTSSDPNLGGLRATKV